LPGSGAIARSFGFSMFVGYVIFLYFAFVPLKAWQELGAPGGIFAWVLILVTWIGTLPGYLIIEPLEIYEGPNYRPHKKGNPPEPNSMYSPRGGASFVGFTKNNGELEDLWEIETTKSWPTDQELIALLRTQRKEPPFIRRTYSVTKDDLVKTVYVFQQQWIESRTTYSTTASYRNGDPIERGPGPLLWNAFASRPPAFTKKEVNVNPGWPQVIKLCATCNSTGLIVCSRCSGTSSITCTSCNGTYSKEWTEVTEDSHATYHTTYTKTCPNCYRGKHACDVAGCRSGQVICTTCNGTTRTINTKYMKVVWTQNTKYKFFGNGSSSFSNFPNVFGNDMAKYCYYASDSQQPQQITVPSNLNEEYGMSSFIRNGFTPIDIENSTTEGSRSVRNGTFAFMLPMLRLVFTERSSNGRTKSAVYHIIPKVYKEEGYSVSDLFVVAEDSA
ncbi:UNVERIFIED_CONTAM: hypothetical protein HDU68_004794, partial [Siphonaria sp. JEL0065]